MIDADLARIVDVHLGKARKVLRRWRQGQHRRAAARGIALIRHDPNRTRGTVVRSMQELWSSASYEPHLLSLLFAFAPAAMLVVIAYSLVMRGEPVLRAWLCMHFVTLLPLFITITLAPSTVSPEAATASFRIAASCVPLSAAAAGAFQFSLVGMHKQTRWFTV